MEEDINFIWEKINCEACYKESINYCKEKCKYKCKNFKTLENLIDIINNSVSKDKIKERIEQLNKGIKEFKEYVADSTGEEKQFYKKQLGQLVSARNELQELLEGDE